MARGGSCTSQGGPFGAGPDRDGQSSRASRACRVPSGPYGSDPGVRPHARAGQCRLRHLIRPSWAGQPGPPRRTGTPAGSRPWLWGRRQATATQGGHPGARGLARQPGGRRGKHLGLLGMGRGAVPHPGADPYLIPLRQRREAAPRARLANVAKLRNKQLRQPLVFQHGPRYEPGQDAGRKDIEPEQIVIEGQPNGREDDHVRNRDTTENGDPADGQGHRQAEIIKLVEPFLNSPDVRICGQVHEVRSFGRDGGFAVTVASGLRARW